MPIQDVNIWDSCGLSSPASTFSRCSLLVRHLRNWAYTATTEMADRAPAQKTPIDSPTIEVVGATCRKKLSVTSYSAVLVALLRKLLLLLLWLHLQ